MCVCVGARARVCQSYDSLNLCYVIKKSIDRVNTFISMYELSRSGELVIYLLHSCKNFVVFLAIEAKSNRKQKIIIIIIIIIITIKYYRALLK